jgi:hypothetical protein
VLAAYAGISVEEFEARSNPFLRSAEHPTLGHDDAECEFDYVSGAEQALERAAKVGWTVASIKNDWTTVF